MLFSDVRTGGRPYGAFTSPADLALILHHELTHFEQYTTPGQGDTMTYNEREAAAWRETAWAVHHIGLSEDEARRFESEATKRMEEYRGRVHDEKWRKMFPRIFGRPEEPNFLLPHQPDELDEIEKGAHDLSEAMAELRKKVKQEHDKLQENAAREEAERQRRQEADLRREASDAVRRLEGLARLACRNPGMLGDTEAEQFRRDYKAFGRHRNEPGFPDRDMLLSKLSGCPLNMFETWERRFSGAKEIDSDEFRSTALSVVEDRNSELDGSLVWLRELGRRACAEPGRFNNEDGWALDTHYSRLSSADTGVVYILPGSALYGLSGCPYTMLERILQAKARQVEAQARGEATYFLGKELNAISLEVTNSLEPAPVRKPGPSPDKGETGTRADSGNEDGGDDPSRNDPRGGGVGDGDGPTKRTGEKIRRNGKWAQ
jgi:hypothetical protein